MISIQLCSIARNTATLVALIAISLVHFAGFFQTAASGINSTKSISGPFNLMQKCYKHYETYGVTLHVYMYYISQFEVENRLNNSKLTAATSSSLDENTQSTVIAVCSFLVASCLNVTIPSTVCQSYFDTSSARSKNKQELL